MSTRASERAASAPTARRSASPTARRFQDASSSVLRPNEEILREHALAGGSVASILSAANYYEVLGLSRDASP